MKNLLINYFLLFALVILPHLILSYAFGGVL